MSDRMESSESDFLGDVTDPEALQRYQTLVNTLDEGIYQLNDEGRFDAVNESIVDLTGYARDDLLGQHLSLVFDEVDCQRIEQEISRRRETNDRHIETFKLTTHTADGEPIPCELRMNLLVTDGEFQGTVCSVRDIREQNDTKASVQDHDRSQQRERQLEQYRALTEAASDVIITIDETSIIQTVNPAVKEVFGYEPDELVGESLTTLMPDKLAPRHHEALKRYLDTGERTLDWDYIELPAVRADDSEIPVAVSFSEVEYGPERYFTGIVRDITERKQIEEQLQESERKFRQIAENIGEVVWLAPPDKREMTYINPAYEEVWDRSCESLYENPTSFLDAIHPEDRNRVRNALEKQPEGEYDEEYRVVRPDGEVRWVRDRAFPIDDEDGQVYRIVGIAEDITERREFEQTLQALNNASQEFLGATTSADVSETVVEITSDVIELPCVVAYRYHSDRDALVPVASTVNTEFPSQEFPELPADESSITGQVFLEGETRYDCDLDDQSRVRVNTTDTKMQSGLFMPVGEHGIIVAGSCEPGGIDDRQCQLLEILAANAESVCDRIERERDLIESEERHRTLIEHFPDGVVGLFDEELTYTTVGGQLLDKIGVSPDDWVGQKIDDVNPDEFVEEVRPYFQAGLDGEMNSFETKYHDRDLVASTLPVRNDNDDIFAGMFVAQDVTEQKRIEHEFEEMVGRITDAFYAVDEEFRFTHVNERAAELLQQPEAELLGETLWERYPEAAEIDEVWDAFHTALNDQEPTSYELYYPPLDFWVEANLYPSESGVSVYFRDVTDRKEREHQLKQTNERLRKSNERLEQFAYAASHDLQEPLRMVSSYLQLLESRYEGKLDENGREFLEFAVDGADRMRAMVAGLLEYSRVETRGDPLEPVDLEEVLAQAKQNLRVKIAETDAEISADTLPRVEGDEDQLRQVFQNLLNNAIEYCGDEPPTIEIGAERTNDEWLISVTDEGIGIDPENQDTIFEVFERLHTHDEHEGTGIGLALCERIVERHGGEIGVESEPGEGTTFSFTLPAAADRDD